MDLESLNEHFVTTAQRSSDCYAAEGNELFDEHDSFELKQVSTSEIINIIKTLRSDSSTGSDCISINYIKLAGEYIAIPIMNLINKCIRDSYFPISLEIRKSISDPESE